MLFNYKVHDDFFNKELTGNIEATTREEAQKIIEEIYSVELDTCPEDLKIIIC